MKSARLILVAAMGVTGLALAGCGGGGNDNGTTAATAAQTGSTPAGKSLTITMADYSFAPKDLTTKAGTVDLSAPNDGQLVHELVLLKTNRPAGSLPLNGNEVDEEGLEAKGVDSPGEIEDVGPGQTKSATLKLTPGTYVMICNIPGHYQRGMYGTVTVK